MFGEKFPIGTVIYFGIFPTFRIRHRVGEGQGWGVQLGNIFYSRHWTGSFTRWHFEKKLDHSVVTPCKFALKFGWMRQVDFGVIRGSDDLGGKIFVANWMLEEKEYEQTRIGYLGYKVNNIWCEVVEITSPCRWFV